MEMVTIIWLGLAIAFAVLEALTLGLTSIWFAVSAAVMCFVSFTDLSLTWQIILFWSLSIGLLLVTKPIVKKKFTAKIEETNTKIGAKGLVTQAMPLRVKLKDVDWAATSEDELTVNDEVIVTSVHGITLEVRKDKK